MKAQKQTTKQILTSTLDHNLENAYSDFEDTFGIGPCGAYAAIRREQGWGEIAICIAHTNNGTEFTHYVIWDDGIIDLANPLDEELTYTDLDILNPDEMPEMIDQAKIDWLKERMI